ncbi:MAG: mechanosensitive ion channel family protein [Bacteroidetes bacterium]|nr:mechanosensitive ion channel family protein [Bacteroidota bacterium]
MWAQNESTTSNSPSKSVDLSTPYRAVFNHLENQQPDNNHPEIAALSLESDGYDDKQLKRLAIKLYQVLNGKGIFVIEDDVPKKPNYFDSSKNEARYYLSPLKAPTLYVEKKDGRWVYPTSSIVTFNELHKEVYPLGADKIVNLIPASWHFRFLGLEAWQYMGILFFVIFALLLHRIFTFIINNLLVRILNRLQKDGHFTINRIIRKSARPLSWAIISIILIRYVPSILLPASVNMYVIGLLGLLTPLLVTIAFYNIVDLIQLFFQRLASKTDTTLDDQLVPLVTRVLKLVVVLIGVVYMLMSLEIDVRPYLLGISFGGIAVALAAQDTIKNIFGSFVIFVDRPFQIGDWINYDGVDGMVEEVGFRSTRLRTFHNSVVSIPNGKLADSKVDNYGMRIYRRYTTKIALTYDTPPELIELFVQGLREMVKSHPLTRKDYIEIHLNDMGIHSLDVLFYIFFDVKTWTEELKGKHEMIKGILELAKELNVRFAFPTQTLHIEEIPGKDSLTPLYNLQSDEYKQAMTRYVEAFKSKYNG